MGGDSSKILVYHHRALDNGEKGLYEMSKQDLATWMDDNPDLQVTVMETSGHSSTTVYMKHLYTAEQQEKYKDKPNYETDIASVKTKGHSELTIVSTRKD